MSKGARVLVALEEAPASAETRVNLAPVPALPAIAPRLVSAKSAVLTRPKEVAALIALSAVLHAGAAYGVYKSEKAPPEKRLSSVNIEFLRPPAPVVEPPPPPPPPPPPEPERAAKPIVQKAVAPEPAPVVPEPPPPDTGSSAEAAEDGNLIAGKGGTGLPPPPPAPVQPAAPAVVAPPPVLQAHEGANYSKNPRPAYPGRAKREGWQGRVLLRVQVHPDGRAGQLSVQKSSGHQQLDDAALEAVKGWTFVPARQGGNPVSGWVTVPIEFRLQ